MSLIQKFSIKRINKIRKLLLLYIDKDLKYQQKNKKLKDSFTEKFENNKSQERYSMPINIEQKFSNVSFEFNPRNQLIQDNLSFKNIPIKSYVSDLIVFSSSRSINNNNNNNKGGKEFLSKNTLYKNNLSENIIYKLQKNKNERKHICKSEKNYIIISDNEINLKKTYLIDLSRSLKNVVKRRKCLSSIKIKKENNKKKDNKKTILEIKKKQKDNNNEYKKNKKNSFFENERSLSIIHINKNDMNLDYKKEKRRSLFYKDKEK